MLAIAGLKQLCGFCGSAGFPRHVQEETHGAKQGRTLEKSFFEHLSEEGVRMDII